ncbi:hypothetical protein, partial [Zooshikella sp. RANM57]|uniref:hypothetical protein n=1 Tax=Zooshikella sp. RANM57 TaxID=3425863 RepID=UPI003D6EDAE0
AAGQLSQFDALFNNPPLGGETFHISGAEINCAPDAPYSHDRAVLKRAFMTDDAELDLLSRLGGGSNTVTRDLPHISQLYRACLFA